MQYLNEATMWSVNDNYVQLKYLLMCAGIISCGELLLCRYQTSPSLDPRETPDMIVHFWSQCEREGLDANTIETGPITR